MSRTHQDGHGRCGACGDAGECRRDREAAWQRADEELLSEDIAATRTTCACGAKLSAHDDEHPGLCCDCFDESFGAPPRRVTA